MRRTKSFKKILRSLGPGFITGASDDDPSGIATYSQTGARFGYSQLWTSLFSFPLMAVIQEMCGRIGIVTGKGLALVIKENYSKKVLYFSVLLILAANTVNIGADLGAMASSGQLLAGRVSFIFWLIFFTILILTLEIFLSYKTYSKILKYFTFSLLAYIVTVFIIHQNWKQVAVSTIIPSIQLNKEYLLNIIALLGTTISPYLFFWQTDEEVEEEIEHHKASASHKWQPRIGKADIGRMRVDTVIGMFLSNVVMFFIIMTAASTLSTRGIHSIETASQAAETLRPIAGNAASLLFAAGIIGTGLLAVPVLSGSASYALAETFNWKVGLFRKLKQAHGFYSVIIIATLIGLLVNFTPIKPFQMLYYTAIFNGVSAPPLMVLIMLISNNKKVMGEHTNGKLSNTVGWAATIIMWIASITLLVSYII